VDLAEDAVRLAGRGEAAVPAREQPHTELRLRVLHRPADPRRGDAEKVGRALHRARHHDGANHLDLPQCQHGVLPRFAPAELTSCMLQTPYGYLRLCNRLPSILVTPALRGGRTGRKNV